MSKENGELTKGIDLKASHGPGMNSFGGAVGYERSGFKTDQEVGRLGGSVG